MIQQIKNTRYISISLILGILLGAGLVLAYAHFSVIKNTLFSISIGEKINCKLASACESNLDELSQEEQIFFISCGGIF